MGTWTGAQLTASWRFTSAEGTDRQYIPSDHITDLYGGSRVRLTFQMKMERVKSEIKSAHLARQIDAKSSEIDTSTDTVLSLLRGKESVVIPAGGTVTSDAVEYPVEALEQVAVTTPALAKVPNTITSHTPGPRCHSWLVA